MVQKLDISSRLCIDGRLGDGYNSWLQVSLNFTDNNTVCMQVQYLPKADEMIILHYWSCAIESREFEL